MAKEEAEAATKKAAEEAEAAAKKAAEEAEAALKTKAEEEQKVVIHNNINKLANLIDKYAEEQLPNLDEFALGPINLKQAKSHLVEQGSELLKNMI